MIAPDHAAHSPEGQAPPPTANAAPPASEAAPGKVARIFDEDEGGFGMEYDNTVGQKHTMRLDALSYEGAIREARSFLGIGDNDTDEDGDCWTVE